MSDENITFPICWANNVIITKLIVPFQKKNISHSANDGICHLSVTLVASYKASDLD